jgi:hypothetical protein
MRHSSACGANRAKQVIAAKRHLGNGHTQRFSNALALKHGERFPPAQKKTAAAWAAVSLDTTNDDSVGYRRGSSSISVLRRHAVTREHFSSFVIS